MVVANQSETVGNRSCDDHMAVVCINAIPGAAGAAVTSARATAMNWRENCNGLLNSNVGEK